MENFDDQCKASIEALKEAMHRWRWFLLTSILISALILVNAYLEQFSYTKAQVSETLINRAGRDRLQELEDMRAALAAQQKPPQREVEEYVERLLGYRSAESMMESIVPGTRDLPILGLKVPANDYLPVMAVFLCLMSTGVWLSSRSVLGVCKVIGDARHKELLSVARLHFAFTGWVSRSAADNVAKLLQRLAMMLPALALLTATVVDVFPVFANQKQFASYGPMAGRLVWLVCLIVATASVGIASILHANEADTIMSPESREGL